MIIMNRRTVQEILPVIVIGFLNDWLLRLMVLLSLLIQFDLILLGSRRKYKPAIWLRFLIWSVYEPKDTILDIVIGILFNCQGNNMIKAFWLILLLQHLGGPDTITAYSLEDNETWKRHSIQLLLKFLWALGIFLRSWKGRPLNILAMPIIVTGLIKSGEKTWFQRSASNDHLIPRPEPGPKLEPDPEPCPCLCPPPCPCPHPPTRCHGSPTVGGCACATFMAGCNGHCCAAFMAEYDGVSYAAFMTECDCKKAEGYCVSCQPESEKSEVVNITSPDPRNESILVTAPLQKAIEFFPKFKRLFTNVVLEPTDLVQSKSFFKKISWEQAFEVIEIELGFIYDIFYTKPMKVYDEWGFVRRFICLFSEISTLMGFLMIDKHEYSTTDVIITWLLLVGAIVLEFYSIILLCSSDWTMSWLNKQEKTRVTSICEARSRFRLPYLFPGNERWSDSMAQYSLISYSLKKLPTKFSEVWKFFFISQMLECSSKNSNAVPKYLKSLIFEQLMEISKSASDIKAGKRLCVHRGDWTLEKMKCFCRLGWSIGEEFDQSILIWHLATDLCYYTDLNKNSSPVKNSNCKASKLLSDYMVYLLVKRPVMLPDGIGKIRFQDSCAEATRFFRSRKHTKDRVHACTKLLLQGKTEIPPLKVKGDRSKSVLLDACSLAESLQSLETEEEWNCEKKWEMMSHVWVEMLCYAACHCPRNRHAEELAKGGELLTHVWLLMAHFGITEHVYLD
ncbi:hypothetical protein PVL29_006767 [Vitis rotundifolia]|uniref:DUF4220 domain-containing protein n=1 Tax=Vitis rotundifolia TaxID=103349 RepID=A0AA39DZA3_VITRO|nr:hypothetical protein PVL29_006767 [Vitis rotundifolia]